MAPLPIKRPLPTPTYNAGGAKVLTRYNETPLKARLLVPYPYSTQSKYGTVIPQKQLNAAYVRTTYPRMS